HICELFTQAGGQVRHRTGIEDAARVHPIRDLSAAKRRQPRGLEAFGDLARGQTRDSIDGAWGQKGGGGHGRADPDLHISVRMLRSPSHGVNKSLPALYFRPDSGRSVKMPDLTEAFPSEHLARVFRALG